MITAIIQARMGSTRLPGKSMMEIEGRPMVSQVIRRVKRARLVRQIILAIPAKDESSSLADIAWQEDVIYYVTGAGIPENDVLSRFYYAAHKHNADPVVRITADCPLIDPRVIDSLINFYLDNHFDYVSTLETYPDGFDTEIFSYAALRLAHLVSLDPAEREHVTSYIRAHNICGTLPYKGMLKNLKPSSAGHSFSVDTKDDLIFARQVYHRCGPNFTLNNVVALSKKLEKENKLNETTSVE